MAIRTLCVTLLSGLPLVAAYVPGVSHLYARSGNNYPPDLEIVNGPTLTSKWFEGSDYEQVIEMVIRNNHPNNYLTSADTLSVSASSPALRQTRSTSFNRLAPGQSGVVQIGVKPVNGHVSGHECDVNVTLEWGRGYGQPKTFSRSTRGICGVQFDYASNQASVNFHWNPDWFNDAKYGIFIHWGIYAVPAYGSLPPNQDYSEWYWKRLNDGPGFRTQTYQHHEKVYGRTFEYDDFIPMFTAEKFNAKTWMDVIADSGAQYFVPVTKHHDGFAIYNTSSSISNRNSVKLGPKRDFLRELFDASRKYYPTMKTGTYFSLPEWYHPDYKKYAYAPGGGFPGGPPKNAYTGTQIPYTGYVKVNDFIENLQNPQMRELVHNYNTDIMWCDIIGSANNAPAMVSDFLNYAHKQNRQVTFNDRCGGGNGVPGDFTTPEYFTNDEIVIKKWESNRGMDPFSYGYNAPTPDSAYLTGNDIVRSLVDIVSKNGNFLLDIGPKADGTIPDIMVKNLRDAGQWISAHKESIFGTRYWPTTPGRDNWRYTHKDDAFYIHYLGQPGSSITTPDKVPFLPGDEVTVLGGSQNGAKVPVVWNGDRTLTLNLNSAVISGDKYVWTFKVKYTSNW